MRWYKQIFPLILWIAYYFILITLFLSVSAHLGWNERPSFKVMLQKFFLHIYTLFSVHSLIYSFSQYLLSSHCAPCIVPASKDGNGLFPLLRVFILSNNFIYWFCSILHISPVFLSTFNGLLQWLIWRLYFSLWIIFSISTNVSWFFTTWFIICKKRNIKLKKL